MHTFSTEGIILKRVDFGEADKLVTVFTKSKGKITSIAKGVRRIESRRAGNIELLNRAKLFFAEGKSLPILTEAESIQTYSGLKKDLRKVGSAYYVTELVDQFFHDHQENFKVYDLLVQTLSIINEMGHEKTDSAIRAFELKLLSLSGYEPQLFSCVKCRSSLTPTKNYLSPEFGGILDQTCVNGSQFIKALTADNLKIMRFAQRQPIDEVVKIRLTDKFGQELRDQMRFYLEYILEKQLVSADFSDRVNRLS